MKIGIISDLHAGFNEMKKAISFLNQQNVDRIICAGDLVDFGTNGDEVVQYITETKTPCVKGNHDRFAEQKQSLRQSKSIKLLQNITLKRLNQLPEKLQFEWLNKTVLLTHATPWGEDLYVYPDSTIPLFRRVLKEAKTDIIILGHTHQPMWIEIDGKTIINSGSTSQNYFMDAGTYGILTLPEAKFHLYSVKNGKMLNLEKVTF